MRWCPYKKINKKTRKDKRNEQEDYYTFSFDITMQKEHKYEYLKCEPSGSKLGYILQSLHSTLENLVAKKSMFYT